MRTQGHSANASVSEIKAVMTVHHRASHAMSSDDDATASHKCRNYDSCQALQPCSIALRMDVLQVTCRMFAKRDSNVALRVAKHACCSPSFAVAVHMPNCQLVKTLR